MANGKINMPGGISVEVDGSPEEVAAECKNYGPRPRSLSRGPMRIRQAANLGERFPR